MATFRVETVEDSATGKIYAELYFPETASSPFVTTDPIYQTHEEAEEGVLEIVKRAFDT